MFKTDLFWSGTSCTKYLKISPLQLNMYVYHYHFHFYYHTTSINKQVYLCKSNSLYILYTNAMTTLRFQINEYSHLFNKRGAWNKRGGGAKVAILLNVELGINVEGGIFGKN